LRVATDVLTWLRRWRTLESPEQPAASGGDAAPRVRSVRRRGGRGLAHHRHGQDVLRCTIWSMTADRSATSTVMGARCLAAYALDVDGTLVGRDGVPEAAWHALRRSRERGVRIGLCTGRLLAGATATLARRVDPAGVHVSQSGAVVSDSDGRSIWSSSLSTTAIEALTEVAAALPVDLELYWHDGFGAAQLTPAVRLHAEQLGVEAAVVPVDDRPPVVTSAACLVRNEDWARVAPLLYELPDLQISPASTPWAPDLVFANVTVAGVSKGSALSVVAKHLDISLDRLAMVGDGENDLEAMQVAGVAVAMGSAPDGVTRVADIVVPDVDEDGLAVALAQLDRFLLPA
jgi:Cof subfamily protein (haloacid dehalogenase superfamily)